MMHPPQEGCGGLVSKLSRQNEAFILFKQLFGDGFIIFSDVPN